MDTYWSDCGEVVKEREMTESAALSEGFEDGHKDKEEREVSDSATLNKGHETQDDFLKVVEEADTTESAGLYRGSGAHVDFPYIESLLGLMIVMGEGLG